MNMKADGPRIIFRETTATHFPTEDGQQYSDLLHPIHRRPGGSGGGGEDGGAEVLPEAKPMPKGAFDAEYFLSLIPEELIGADVHATTGARGFFKVSEDMRCATFVGFSTF